MWVTAKRMPDGYNTNVRCLQCGTEVVVRCPVEKPKDTVYTTHSIKGGGSYITYGSVHNIVFTAASVQECTEWVEARTRMDRIGCRLAAMNIGQLTTILRNALWLCDSPVWLELTALLQKASARKSAPRRTIVRACILVTKLDAERARVLRSIGAQEIAGRTKV